MSCSKHIITKSIDGDYWYCQHCPQEFLPTEKPSKVEKCHCLKSPHFYESGKAFLLNNALCPCACHKTEEKQGFWKGNKRREGTEHLVYTVKDGEGVGGCKPEQKKGECCIGFPLDGVVFHECKVHKPYCAKEWPCQCGGSYVDPCAECLKTIHQCTRCTSSEPCKPQTHEEAGAKCDHMFITNLWGTYCTRCGAKPSSTPQTYTREEIDARLKPFLDYLVHACTDKAEEREWRAALLDFLALPNVGITRGGHLTWKEMDEKFNELKKRFL